MRVALLVTGRMEVEGLPHALRTQFPGHDFEAITRLSDGTPFDGFTSSRLPLRERAGAKTNQDKLVEQLCAELVPGRGFEAPDYVFVLDDLELDNADQPEVVIDCFREAIVRHLAELEQIGSSRFVERVREALRMKASFHLAVPMTEAWLFADPEGPSHAGAPPAHLPPNLVNDATPESFETDDELYSQDVGCPSWTDLSPTQQRRRRRTHRPLWLRDERELHPKAYLAWLCRHPNEKKCSTYRETAGKSGGPSGAGALALLNWGEVLGVNCPFLFAFIEDLGEALGVPLSVANEAVSAYTGFYAAHARENLLLRNI